MTNNKIYYLMSPEQYSHLSSVSGFTNWNGKTYQEHITINFSDIFTNNQKVEIEETNSINEAFELLQTWNINYTHNFEDRTIE